MSGVFMPDTLWRYGIILVWGWRGDMRIRGREVGVMV